MVLGDRQQMIIDLEPFGSIEVIGPGDFHQLLVTEIVARDPARLDDRLTRNGETGLADVVFRREQARAQRLGENVGETRPLLDSGKVRGHREIVPSRRILRCNCMIPYSNASAVGGQPGT